MKNMVVYFNSCLILYEINKFFYKMRKGKRMAKIDKLIDYIDIGNVSDIHITSGLPPMVRIDGHLVDAYEDVIPNEVVEEYIKIA